MKSQNSESRLKFRKHLVVRCLTKKYYGMGHFRRCQTLAEELRKHNYDIHFIISKNEIVQRELDSKKLHYSIISNTSNIDKEFNAISKIMIEKKYKIILIDMRQFGEQLSRKLNEKKFKIIAIDDAWIKKIYADMIFNGTMVKKYHKYTRIKKNCKIFTGTKYFIIKNSFVKFRKKRNDIQNKSHYNVVISTGGTDPNKVNSLILSSILSIPSIKIRVIVGPYSKNIKNIIKTSQTHNNIKTIFSPKKIWKEFQKADIVISNAGNTLFELAVQEIPTIAIAAEEHQEPYGKKFSSKGFGMYIGLWKKVKATKIRNILLFCLSDKTIRKKISKNGRRIIDGKGSNRVVMEINKQVKKWTKC